MSIATRASQAPAFVRKTAEAANRFLNSLDAAQRKKATFPFAGDERYLWAYTPTPRNGLLIRDMSDEQRKLAFALMETGYSKGGYRVAREIVALETILGEWEAMTNHPSQWERKPEIYWFSVFGTPGSRDPWGWRVGGHHIGLHVTVVNGDFVSIMPLFFGANPAEVKHGPAKGKRVLALEEDAGRDLVKSLDASQQKIAIVDPVAPADILTKNYRAVEPGMPLHGIAYDRLKAEQQTRLVNLIRHYVNRAPDDIARNQWRNFESEGFGSVKFAWAGPVEPGKGHYYSIVANSFMIEYDNTQNDANHIHSVLREFKGDWGEDLLAAHYHASH